MTIDQLTGLGLIAIPVILGFIGFQLARVTYTESERDDNEY